MDKKTFDTIKHHHDESEKWQERWTDWIKEQFKKVYLLHQKSQSPYKIQSVYSCWHQGAFQYYKLPSWKNYFYWQSDLTWLSLLDNRFHILGVWRHRQKSKKKFLETFNKYVKKNNLELDCDLDKLRINGSINIRYSGIDFSNKLFEISNKLHVFDTSLNATLQEFKLIK